MLLLHPLLAFALALPPAGPLFCDASFAEGQRFGLVILGVDGDYAPQSMKLSIRSRDGWSGADIALDPMRRRLPGTLEGAEFAVRFTRRPALPLTMRAFADGVLRWRKPIAVPFWPTTLSANGKHVGRDAPGTADYVSRADDGLPVPTPRVLRIELTDARGRAVGEADLPLPGAEPAPELSVALDAVERQLAERVCDPPPPPID